MRLRKESKQAKQWESCSPTLKMFVLKPLLSLCSWVYSKFTSFKRIADNPKSPESPPDAPDCKRNVSCYPVEQIEQTELRKRSRRGSYDSITANHTDLDADTMVDDDKRRSARESSHQHLWVDIPGSFFPETKEDKIYWLQQMQEIFQEEFKIFSKRFDAGTESHEASSEVCQETCLAKHFEHLENQLMKALGTENREDWLQARIVAQFEHLKSQLIIALEKNEADRYLGGYAEQKEDKFAQLEAKFTTELQQIKSELNHKLESEMNLLNDKLERILYLFSSENWGARDSHRYTVPAGRKGLNKQPSKVPSKLQNINGESPISSETRLLKESDDTSQLSCSTTLRNFCSF